MIDNLAGSEHRPIIITRPQRAAERTAEKLRAAGADGGRIVISPLVEIAPTAAVSGLDRGRAAVFTSENGVLAAPMPPPGITAWCVGNRTASAARRRGYSAKAASGNAESLIDLLRQFRPEEPLIWLRGRHFAVDMESRLIALGLQVESAVVYDQAALKLSPEALDLLRSAACVLPLFSPRTAEILCSEALGMPDPGHCICCLSGRVREACHLGWKTETAADAENLVQMTVNRAMRTTQLNE